VLSTTMQDAANAGTMRALRVMRLVRIVRALRVQRLISLVDGLRTLVYSIVVTLKSLFWAIVLLTIIMYVVGVTLTQVVIEHFNQMGPQGQRHEGLDRFFSSLDSTMFTLFESISGGLSWDEATRSLGEVSFLLVWLYTAYIAFTCFAVLNVVTGVFCHSAIESAQKNPDVIAQALIANQKMYIKNIERLFAQVDADKSAVISFAEFEKVVTDPTSRAYMAAMEIEAMDAWTLFKLLDTDKDGVIELEEFVTGCLQLKGVAKNVEIANVTYGLNKLERKLGKLSACLEEIRRGLGLLHARDGLHQGETPA